MGKNEEDFAKNLKKIRVVNTVFIIAAKELRTAKTGTRFIDLTLSDKTGTIIGRIFTDNAEKEYEKFKEGTCYQVQGDIQEFPRNSGKFTLKIASLQPLAESEYDIDDFIRVAEQDPRAMMDEITQTIKEIKNPFLKELLESFFFQDPEFRKNFTECPAAKTWHHNYLHGLLEHTVGVLRICKTICRVHPELDQDLLYTGAILHDIGKLLCYEYDLVSIEKTLRGQLNDHIPISNCSITGNAAMILSKYNKNGASGKLSAAACEESLIQLQHLILSHHGDVKMGWGSVVDPKTPEAVALHHADNMDAKVKGIIQEVV